MSVFDCGLAGAGSEQGETLSTAASSTPVRQDTTSSTGNLRLGTYVLARMIEQLCGKANWVDFGLGDAEHERHFAAESRTEEDVLLSARRRWRGRLAERGRR